MGDMAFQVEVGGQSDMVLLADGDYMWIKHEFVFTSASRRKKLREYFKTVRTESASEGGTYHPQIIIIMGSNYFKDAVPGQEYSSGVEHLPRVCDACVQSPEPHTRD